MTSDTYHNHVAQVLFPELPRRSGRESLVRNLCVLLILSGALLAVCHDFMVPDHPDFFHEVLKSDTAEGKETIDTGMTAAKADAESALQFTLPGQSAALLKWPLLLADGAVPNSIFALLVADLPPPVVVVAGVWSFCAFFLPRASSLISFFSRYSSSLRQLSRDARAVCHGVYGFSRKYSSGGLFMNRTGGGMPC